MSKAANIRAVKKKQELQASFQLAVAQTNLKILSWMNPGAETAVVEETSGTSFFDLPVVNSGSGINLGERATTIGDFMNTDKKLESLKKGRDEGSAVARNSSRALQALSNKMRDNHRKQVRDGTSKAPRGRPSTIAGALSAARKPAPELVSPPVEDDGDDDARARSQRTVKKGTGIVFGKVKKRPF